eukprot:4860472-Amphidinium_carterae.1
MDNAFAMITTVITWSLQASSKIQTGITSESCGRSVTRALADKAEYQMKHMGNLARHGDRKFNLLSVFKQPLKAAKWSNYLENEL